MTYLNIKNISFAYGSVTILEQLDLEADIGQIVMITGPSGSGKTTLLDIVADYTKPQTGEVFPSVRPTAFVFQAPSLIKGFSVLDNVSLPLLLNGTSLRSANEKAQEALDRIGLGDRGKSDKNELSEGEQSRVGLARALAQNSPIILLDEPTGALDEKNSIMMMEMVKKIKSSHVILMVTHNLQLAYDYGDVVYKLENKKLHLIFGSSSRSLDEENKKTKKEKYHHLSFFTIFRIGYLFLLDKLKSSLLSVFFIALTLSLMLVTINISSNGANMAQLSSKEIYNSNIVSLSSTRRINTPSGLSLIKRSEPSRDYLEKIKTQYNATELLVFDQFIKPSIKILKRSKKEFVAARFECSLPNEKKILAGRLPQKYSELLINQNLLNELGYTKENIGHIFVDYSFDELINTKTDVNDCVDRIDFKIAFSVVGVTTESLGFNSPSIYYDYEGMYRFFDAILLSKASIANERPYSLIKRLILAEENDPINGYKILLKVEDFMKLESELLKDHELESKALSIKKSTKELFDNLLVIMMVFLALVLIGAFFMQFITIKTLYEEQKKKLAIFKTFCHQKKNYKRVFYSLAKMLTAPIFLLSITLQYLGQFVINSLLKSNNLFALVDVSLISFPTIGLILVSYFLSHFSAYLSYRSLRKENILAVLKED